MKAVYIPSKILDIREDVPRTEESEPLNEESYFQYTEIEHKKYEGKSGGISTDKYDRVIETNAPIQFKKDDVVIIDNDRFKIKEINITIPKNREKAVKMWPLTKLRHSIKRLYLK